jgi:hypothetical protein
MSYTCTIPNGKDTINYSLISVLNQKLLPSEIIIAVDNKNYVDNGILNSLKHKNIKIVMLFDHFKNLSHMRYEMFKVSTEKYVLSMDDDIVLDRNCTSILYNTLLKQKNCFFVSGLRIEVGGRDNNSPLDVNPVRSKADFKEIPFGDGSLTLLNRQDVLSINWDTLLSTYGKNSKQLAGEDIVMCLLTRKKTSKIGYGNPEAIGYHLAKPNFSYWNTFIAQDKYIIEAFQDIIPKNMLEEVYFYMEKK